VDITPRFEKKIIEETDRYVISTSSWGVTLKQFKEEDSTPEFLDYTVTTPETWEIAKARMTLDDDRIPWEVLKRNYDRWLAEGQWIRADFWFGFDVTHSWMSGTETILVAMLEEPEFVTDIFDTYLDRCIRLFEKVWDAGYRFDEINWPDDMGYKSTTFFSPDMYRRLLKPYHKKVVDWAHERGMVTELHSCGFIEPLLPDVVETGVEMLNPLEVKAGMNPNRLKSTYGDRLAFHGGINAQLWDNIDLVKAEMERIIPVMKEGGGYIFASDHSIPNSVSFQNMKEITELAKRLGKY
jgi:uroporphyrinogen decarboxylase